MRRALGFGLVLLTASAAAAQNAQTRGPEAARGVQFLGAAHFFLSGAGTSSARSTPGYLGVDVRDVPPDQVAALKLKDARGAEIVLVDHDAPAGKAGLREHDVILRLNGQDIAGEEQITQMLHGTAPGKTITLLISRDGQQMTVTTQVANRAEVERQAWEKHLAVSEPPPPASDSADGDYDISPNSASSAPTVRGNNFLDPQLLDPSYTGAQLEKMSGQLAEYFGAPSGSGLLVRSVEANSPAALAGLQAGDVVVRANAHVVVSAGDWAKAIRDSRGRSLAVVVLRDKKEQTLTLTPDGKKRSSVEWPRADDSTSVALAPIGFFPMQRF